MLRVTLTAVKADIGSIGGHIRPSVSLLDEVEKSLKPHLGKDIIDFRLSFTGDDIAILMTHTNGTDNPLIHQMAWDAFKAAADVAKEEGLYGAGQDLLKDAFSGNIRGLGPGIAEMEFEERKASPFCFLPPTRPIQAPSICLVFGILRSHVQQRTAFVAKFVQRF